MPIVYVTRSPYPFEVTDDQCDGSVDLLAEDHWCGENFTKAPYDQRLWLNSPAGLLSPDGEWLASPCWVDSYNILKVGPVGQSPAWQLIYDEKAVATYNGSGFYYPYRWSLDGQYIYYVPWLSEIGGNLYGRDGHALLRLDIRTGEISEILPPLGGLNFYALAFSPDMRQLAYSEQVDWSLKLTIRDLATNQSVHFRLDKEFCFLGDLVWSPENDRLFGLAWKCGEEYGYFGLYTLFLFDIEHQTQTAFFPDLDNSLFPFRWDDQGAIFQFFHQDMGYYPWFSYDDFEEYPMYYSIDPETGTTKNIPSYELIPTPPDYW